MSAPAAVSSPQPTASSIGFVECGSVRACDMKNSTNPVVAEPVVRVVLRPALVGVERLVERDRRRGRHVTAPSGTAGAMKTMPVTRSGCSAASTTPQSAPNETPRGRPAPSRSRRGPRARPPRTRASSTPRHPCGRSERPFPRASKVRTRQCRAKYGICIFQWREWTSAHVGMSKTVGSPVAIDLVEDPDAVALDVALFVGVPRARLLAHRLDRRHDNLPLSDSDEVAHQQVDT